MIHHAKGEGIAAEEFDQRVHHVDAPDLGVADILKLAAEDLGLLLDHEHRPGLIHRRRGRRLEEAVEGGEHHADQDEPGAGAEDMVVLAPVELRAVMGRG